jgi:hypothetical protein
LVSRRWLAVPVLCAVALLANACGTSSPRRTGPSVAPSPSPSPAISSAAAPPGVSLRNDCSNISRVNEPDCGRRVPTALPPGGLQEAVDSGPEVVAQVLCSAVSDTDMKVVLGGDFYAYTNPKGACRFDKPYTDYAVHLTIELSPYSLNTFRAGDGKGWRAFPLNGHDAGYVEPYGEVRWYRIGLTSNPSAVGALVVLFQYTRFVNPNSAKTVPAPPAFYARTDRYVRQLVAALLP